MPERCVDASIAIKWVLKNEAWRKKARQFLVDSLAADFSLIAPPLFEYETESVVQGRVQSGVLSVAEANAALARLTAIGVRIVSPSGMVSRAREIARQIGQSNIYDALYAALAKLRRCEFWTADRKFHEAASSTLPFVKYLPEYEDTDAKASGSEEEM